MLRTLSYIPSPSFLLYLLLVLLLRIPSLLGDFFLAEESLFYVFAQSINEGNILYKDLWHAGPPLMIWWYQVVHALFGSGTIIAMEIFACLYVYILALYVTGMFAAEKPFQRASVLPGVWVILLSAVPWYTQQFSGALAIMLPVTIGYHALIQIDENRTQNFARMFRAGFFLSLAVLMAFKAIFLWVGVLISYVLFQRARWDELFSFLGGSFLVNFGVGLMLFLRGSLKSFWEVGLLFDVDRFGQSEAFYSEVTQTSPWIDWLITGGFVILLCIIGMIHFRLRFYSYLAKIRNLELTLFAYLISALLMLAFKWTWVRAEDFLVLILPISFYATKTFDFRLTRRLQWVLIVLIAAFPTYQYAAFLPVLGSASFPPSQNTLRVGNAYQYSEAFADIQAQWEGKKVQDVWIMDHRPELYPILDVFPRLPYVDFRIAYYKIPVFASDKDYLEWSQPADLGDVYEAFRSYPPQYIIDPADRFPALVQRFPFLSQLYERESSDKHIIYRRKD